MNWPTKLPRIGLRLLRFGERRPRLGSPTARRVPPAARQDLTVKKEQRRINYCRLTFRVQLHGPLTDCGRSAQAPVPDATTRHRAAAWPCQLQRLVRRQPTVTVWALPRGLLNETSADPQRWRSGTLLAPRAHNRPRSPHRTENPTKCSTWPTKPSRNGLPVTPLRRKTASARPATDSASSTHRRAQRAWEREEDSEELAGA